MSRKKKITIEMVKEKLSECGNELLETEYISPKTKMKYKCIKHNFIHYGTWDSIRKEKACCPLCKNERISKGQLLDFNYAKSVVEEKGYTLISNEYQGNKKKLIMKCKIHGEFKLTFDALKSGQGCQKCGKVKQINSQKLDYNFVKSEFDKHNYILLETEYINCETPMRYICPYHPEKENKISYSNLKNGKGCRECYEDSIKGENSYLWQGGLTQENKLIRNQSEYRNWRKSVFERDNYTCQCCGERGEILHAHHIKNFSNHEDKRFDINNGITLCKDCHDPSIEGSFHKIYGTHNNNR